MKEPISQPSNSLSLSLSLSLSKGTLGILLAAFSMGGLVNPSLSQTASTPKRVIHLWVDAIRGVNGTPQGTPGAAWANPRCGSAPNGCGTNECKPNQVFLGTGEVLLHAPWPFKTITGPNGALSYIPPLPSSGPVIWEYAIIHLLPGLYARSNAYTTGANPLPNPDNGLMPNGEIFPIHLPHNVSIQGTSALNTIFDVGSMATGVAGPAFEFGVPGSNGEGSFIDSIAIFGASAELNSLPDPRGSSAIYIDKQVASSPTISNCFIYGNGVGILVNASNNGGVVHDGTKLFNNTLAFNEIGLWNGQRGLGPNSKGLSKLILVNNIFDSSFDYFTAHAYPRHWKTFQKNAAGVYPITSGFEGVDPNDLEIQLSGSSVFKSNAFEGNRVNYRISFLFSLGLDITTKRNGNLPKPTPKVDIEPYTYGNQVSFVLPLQPSRRGILYVRDALSLPVFQDSNRPKFDGSPGDFRLFPMVSKGVLVKSGLPGAISAPGTMSTGHLNPLVNQGWSGSFPFTMKNGLVVSNPPGYLDLGVSDQNTWPYHCWNWDAEGYGNPRMLTYGTGTFFPKPNGTTIFSIDIGADELGENLIGGMVFGTDRFMKFTSKTPQHPVLIDNDRLWYFGPRDVNLSGKTPPIPVAAFKIKYRGIDLNLQGTGTHIYPVNYQKSGEFAPWSDLFSLTTSGTYYVPSMASITPHLLDDVHPWWGPLTQLFPSNPFWQGCVSGYNPYLYVDPSVGRINPPGTFKDMGSSSAIRYLDITWNFTKDSQGNPIPASAFIYPFGVKAPFRNPVMNRLTRFDQWGRGFDNSTQNAPKVSVFPKTLANQGTPPPLMILRYALEPYPISYFAGEKNVQSFEVVIE